MGYCVVVLRDTHNRNNAIRIHTLVARHFIPNPSNKPQIDHINNIRSDNRVSNLRWATRSENNANRVSTGVYARRNKWIAYVTKLGINYSKLCDTQEEARTWYKAKHIELFGEFSPHYINQAQTQAETQAETPIVAVASS